jgi:hypothetical protein
MEAARTSETLVQLYQTTRCYNPEDSHLHTHRRENIKSYLCKIVKISNLQNVCSFPRSSELLLSCMIEHQ